MPKTVNEVKILNSEKFNSLICLGEGVTTLSISGSSSLKYLDGLPQTLKHINVSNCNQLIGFENKIHTLETLEVDYCPAFDLNSLPSNLQIFKFNGDSFSGDDLVLPSSLLDVTMYNFNGRDLSLFKDCTLLKKISLRDCHNLTSLCGMPDGLESFELISAPKLADFYLEAHNAPNIFLNWCTNLKKIDIKSKKLEVIEIHNCELLESVDINVSTMLFCNLVVSKSLQKLNLNVEFLANLLIKEFNFANSFNFPTYIGNLELVGCSIESFFGINVDSSIKLHAIDKLISLESLPTDLKNLYIDYESRTNLDEESLKKLEKFGI